MFLKYISSLLLGFSYMTLESPCGLQIKLYKCIVKLHTPDLEEKS
jgi:hypothetical protein